MSIYRKKEQTYYFVINVVFMKILNNNYFLRNIKVSTVVHWITTKKDNSFC